MVWRGMPFEVLSSREMVEKDLGLVWEWFDYRLNVVGECFPNAGHTALAEAQQSGRFEEFTLVTQNVDGLHEEAGSVEVIELHGNIRQARCLSCGFVAPLPELPRSRPPACPECSGRMRPNVVLFGEFLRAESIMKAQQMAERCDVCLVVGTSALVYPAADLPVAAKLAGASVIEVNPEETVLTPLCDVSLRGNSADMLPRILTSTDS